MSYTDRYEDAPKFRYAKKMAADLRRTEDKRIIHQQLREDVEDRDLRAKEYDPYYDDPYYEDPYDDDWLNDYSDRDFADRDYDGPPFEEDRYDDYDDYRDYEWEPWDYY